MTTQLSPHDRLAALRQRFPAGGFFAEKEWRLSPYPFSLPPKFAAELERLGRVLLQFNKAVNLLYRQSVAGKQPHWIADLLDRGKDPALVGLQRSNSFKNDLPRVIRPDILLTEDGFAIAELDSIPGAIGVTAWMNEQYSSFGDPVIGGADGMKDGFAGIFGAAKRVKIIVSEEASGYRPEMEWLVPKLGADRFQVHDASFEQFEEGDAVYRFFELFDLPNVPDSARIFELASERRITLTPAPKPIFEEKLLFALFWNRNLREFWRRELGENFLKILQRHIPYSWVVDPTPIPPHAAIPELNLSGWQELKELSQRERELILKISGYSENAWGARGVYLGSDLSKVEWAEAVDLALTSFQSSPFVLQRYQKPSLHPCSFGDSNGAIQSSQGRVRLCPYYFVSGEFDRPDVSLGGALATICPPDKKIVHGMPDAIMTACVAGDLSNTSAT